MTPEPLQYYDDPEATSRAQSEDGKLATTGDVGYLDEDGYLYLTDRKSFTHHLGRREHLSTGGRGRTDRARQGRRRRAVFGVPNAEYGEEVKAVVQPMEGVEQGAELEAELMEYCRANFAQYKCPRSIDFERQLPRSPTGKLYKRQLRDRYWGDSTSRISAS